MIGNGIYFSPPGEPEFEDVVVPTTLDHFVTCIVGDIVVLVLLEQVVGAHSVAVIQQALIFKVYIIS